VLVEDLGPAVGEGSLGILLAFGLSTPDHLVVVPFLAPLLAALYRSKATLEQLREETAKALESLAHVIDARDSSTSEHTERGTAAWRRASWTRSVDTRACPPSCSGRSTSRARWRSSSSCITSATTARATTACRGRRSRSRRMCSSPPTASTP